MSGVVLYPPPANAPRLRTVTRADVLSWWPCWANDARVSRLDALLALAPAEATARDALRICREGGVSAEDMLWLLLQPDWWECPDVVLRALACDYASAVLSVGSDPRSLEAVRVAWRHARGEATRVELAAAWAAARDAAWDAWGDAARGAAWGAVGAARDARIAGAAGAARDAAGAAGDAARAAGAARDAAGDAARDAASAAAWNARDARDARDAKVAAVAAQVQRIADLLALPDAA